MAAVRAPAEMVYDRISDVTRMGQWSPENQGGEWLDWATGAPLALASEAATSGTRLGQPRRWSPKAEGDRVFGCGS
jgi:hypothetical protein